MLLPKFPHEANFDELRTVLLRQDEIGRVPVMEMLVGREIIATLMGVDAANTPLDKIEGERWTRMMVELWTAVGADAIRCDRSTLCRLAAKKLRTRRDSAGASANGRR